MRWKLLRRRLSVSAPRVIVRSHLPWPLRWAVLALMFGFSASLALWAFEFGKDIAGLDHGAKQEAVRLREQLGSLRSAYQQAQAVANSADSLLKAEHAAQERLAAQVKTLEMQNAELSRDLGFFEKLLPAKGEQALAVRGVQAKVQGPGQLQYQLLVMQPQAARGASEFRGRYEVTLNGTLDGRAWAWAVPGGPWPLALRQYQRVEGVIDYPATAVVRQFTVKVFDVGGTLLATEMTGL